MKALFQCIMFPLRNLSSPVTLRCSQWESLLQGAVDEVPDLPYTSPVTLSLPATLRCSQSESLLQGIVDELPDLTDTLNPSTAPWKYRYSSNYACHVQKICTRFFVKYIRSLLYLYMLLQTCHYYLSNGLLIISKLHITIYIEPLEC